MSKLILVSKEAFFAVIGPLDVHPRPFPCSSMWETRSRVLIGKTTPGYANGWTPEGKAPKVYMLTPEALATYTEKL